MKTEYTTGDSIEQSGTDKGPDTRTALLPVSSLHRFLFVRHRRASLVASIIVYAVIVLALGRSLAISNNYFVAFPVIVAALTGGVRGGLIAGALGLPANLLLFAAIGHPEFSPASKPIAEGFGILVGASLGYLSEYYRELEGEIRRRMRTEESLRKALEEKGLLLEELHHRVKNNLNVIKGLVRLQRSRSSDPAFVAAADELVNRILVISQVHDQLYQSDSPFVEPGPYLESIAANVASTFDPSRAKISVSVGEGVGSLSSKTAIPLGIIVNEALTNALKHATVPEEGPSVALSLESSGDECRLAIRDNGPGLEPGQKPGRGEGPAPGSEPEGGLGLKLVRALAGQLGGSVELSTAEGPGGEPAGALFTLRWPRERRRPDLDGEPGRG